MENTESSFSGEFERLLNEQIGRFRPGNIVSGTIVDIGKEYVTVDVGFKSDGIVPLEQFPVVDGKLSVKVGDVIEVFILATENDVGQVSLSFEKAHQKRTWSMVEDAFKASAIISGTVLHKVKGGLQVDIGIPAFLPGSQVDVRPHRNLDKFIGQNFDFKVLKINREKGNIVLSRRAVLLSERDQLRAKTLEVISEGVVMEGAVKNLTEYGAFIDLGGLDGLVHITDISWGRVNHPSERLNVGQNVQVVVLKYDAEKQRVSLGMKQLKSDPWVGIKERYMVGQRVRGKVIGLVDYGAFVEIEDGVDGLVHQNDLGWMSKKGKLHPSKVLSEGEMVEAVILGIDEAERKVSLGMKQIQPNPWQELKAKLPVGTKIRGPVRAVSDFGIFVGLEDGIDGLVHHSDFSWTKRIKDAKEIQQMFKKGDEVEAVVLEVNPDSERIGLGIKQLSDDPWATVIPQRYPIGTKVKGTVTTVADFGVFVDIGDGLEGLIHTTQLGLDKDATVESAFPVGKEVEADVLKVEPTDRKISLTLIPQQQRRRKDKDSGSDAAQYMQDSDSGMFTFKTLLEGAINKSGGNE